MVTKITTHIEDAKNRLLFQYKNSTKLHDLTDAFFLEQVQDIEDALYGLLNRLNIDGSSGIQLDHIGNIVGQEREGFSDTIYRLFLKAKIGQNISCGDIERVLSIWSLITQAGIIELIEAYPAEVDLWTDTPLDAAIIDIAFELIQKVVSAGVAVHHVGVFDPDEAFAFEGGGAETKGFGSIYDIELGGKLSYIQAHI